MIYLDTYVKHLQFLSRRFLWSNLEVVGINWSDSLEMEWFLTGLFFCSVNMFNAQEIKT